MNTKLRISVCQYKIVDDKTINILNTFNQIVAASEKNPNIVVLPECFVCPYDINIFKENSEPIDNFFDSIKSPATCMLRNASIKYPNIYIVGGTIIESEYVEQLDKTLYFNTCLVFKNGIIIGKYRKMNLYNINIKEHYYCEADVLTNGIIPTIFDTEFGKVGLGICYDIRFGNLAEFYQKKGCNIIIYPGSFNRFTGPKHWLVLQKARALDNQLFIVSCSSACQFNSCYESYGKSFIISPWADIINETEIDKEEIITSEIDINDVTLTRTKLPILKSINNIKIESKLF